MTAQTSEPIPPGRTRPFFSYAAQTDRQIERVNAESGIPVDFRPTAGLTPRIIIEGGQSQSFSLWHTSSRTGFLTVPKFDVDVITIRFVTEGSMVRRDHRREHIGRPHKAMMVAFDTMRNEEFSTGFAAISATITRDALRRAHLALEGMNHVVPLPDFVPVVDVTSLPLQNLKETMDHVICKLKSGVDITDLVFPLIEEVMIYRLLTAWPRNNSDTKSIVSVSSSKIVKNAIAYIDVNIAHKMTLSEIASATGVGTRTLQQYFKIEIDKSPVQHIIEKRLDRVRADLQVSFSDEISIATVAARWGFVHMSDFSRRYRARFGEAPSSTRRRR